VANVGMASMGSGGTRSREALAVVFRSLAADTAGSDPGQLLSEAVAGGLLIADDVVGCSISEIDAGGWCTSVYAGEAAIALDLVQYAAGRGPCLTAIRRGLMGIIDDPADLGGSLPGWAEQANKYGVASVLSVPLPGAEPAAGINFYAADPAVFRAAPVVAARALLVSRAVTVLLTRGTAPAQGTTPAAASGRALLAGARAAVARAGGVSDTEAFTCLARRSAREGRSILDVARDVLASSGRPAGQELRS
jgi:hypothetical protein